MISLLSFLIVISICVMFHEGGHYFAARWRGVLVHEFSFGMGPAIWSRKKGETVWSVRAFPIGGFVRLEGEDESEEAEQAKPSGYDPARSLMHKKPWERFVILSAGAVINLILAWLLTAALLAGNGVLDLESTRIGVVMQGTPAQEFDIRIGDVITQINGKPLYEWADIRKHIQDKDAVGDQFSIVIKRGDATIAKEITIKAGKDGAPRLLGVQPAHAIYPIHSALLRGFGYAWLMGVDILTGLWMFVTGQIKPDIVGPVGIAVMAGDAFKQGFWSFIAFLGVINLHLGLLNLLPFPALDGGRLVFVLIEMVTRRKVSEKWEAWVHYGGFLILLALIVLVTGKDIARLFNN